MSTAASPLDVSVKSAPQAGGRKKNPWLAHVKATMRGHRNKSFRQVLKLAKKSYKRAKSNRQSQSQSQSQNGGKRKNRRGGSNQQQQYQQQQQQQGGSGVGGGKEGMAAFGANAEPVA
jgi:hypothetical protein